MMRTAKFLVNWLPTTMSIILVVAASMSALAAAVPHPGAKQQGSSPKAAQQSEGERAFRQNCSRCHSAPEGFPPSISGSIVRHMRVRANLSSQEERAILKFLNP